MKTAWFCGRSAAAFAALGISAALAADLPTHKEPPAPLAPAAAPFSWTGFYIGVNAGALWGTSSVDVTGTPEFQALGPYGIVPAGFGDNSQAGFIGGGQIGYNFQSGPWVVGVETDIDGTSLRRSGSFTGASLAVLNEDLPDSTLASSASSRLDWLGTARLRLGFTPTERVLLFATGGLAYGGGSAFGSVVANIDPVDVNWYGSTSSTRVGWTVGAGVEYAITNNVTVKAEYLYYDLGRVDVAAYGSAGALDLTDANLYLTTKADINGSIARAGLNFKF